MTGLHDLLWRYSESMQRMSKEYEDLALQSLIRTSSVPDETLIFLASNLVAEFGHIYPAWDLVAARSELAEDSGHGLPLHLVAIENGQPLGVAAIISDDEVTGWEEKNWWLANVLVFPEHRDRGVGISLVNRAIEIARDSGAHELHLVTDTAESWYAKHGWESVGIGEVHGHQMIVMRLDLRAN
jgi:predicted N-acetyltransferase YhbS